MAVRGSAAAARKQRGDYPTPAWLVATVVDGVLAHLEPEPGRPVRVVDPACGDGRFVVAAAEWLLDRGYAVEATGTDISATAVAQAARHLGDLAATHEVRLRWHVDVADGLEHGIDPPVDVVVGNPPYLSQLAASTTRGGSSRRGGGPYADVAAEFLDLAVSGCRPGGVVALVLPQSVLASRDVAPIRRRVDHECDRVWAWWSPRQVFEEAAVVACAVGLRRRDQPRSTIDVDGPASWGDIVTDALGIPPLPALVCEGTVGDRWRVTAEFRDVYYGLAAAVVESDDALVGPPLVTSGMIEPLEHRWGQRSARVAGQQWLRPRVELARLTPKLRDWADAQLAPKLLLANQSRIVEVVVDAAGELLPGVPVLSARPLTSTTAGPGPQHGPNLDAAAAVLSSPVATIALWQRQAGTGRSGSAIRLSPAAVAAVPWPAGSLGAAQEAVAAGDLERAADASLTAYGVDVDERRRLLAWWAEWCRRGVRRTGRSQTQPP